MRNVLFLLFFSVLASFQVMASPASKLNICAAWLSTYQQFHPDDKDTSILLSDYEGELKRLDLYSVDQIENALDLPMMESAADNSKQTIKDLTMCREIATNFVGNQR
ncbi:hypothetical protein KB816_002863 [Salmonella enterica]|nr:hypothetical protein [Salmonella enterica]